MAVYPWALWCPINALSLIFVIPDINLLIYPGSKDINLSINSSGASFVSLSLLYFLDRSLFNTAILLYSLGKSSLTRDNIDVIALI
jgi:hypothetical protein